MKHKALKSFEGVSTLTRGVSGDTQALAGAYAKLLQIERTNRVCCSRATGWVAGSHSPRIKSAGMEDECW